MKKNKPSDFVRAWKTLEARPLKAKDYAVLRRQLKEIDERLWQLQRAEREERR